MPEITDSLHDLALAAERSADPTQDRSQRLGSGDIAALLGLSPWTSSYQLAQAKRGQLDTWADSAAADRGRWLERVILARYWHQLTAPGLVQVTAPDAPLIHPIYEWATASPDAVCVDVSTQQTWIVEAKSTSRPLRHVPTYWSAQVHWQWLILRDRLPEWAELQDWVDVTIWSTVYRADDYQTTIRHPIDVEWAEQIWDEAATWWRRVTEEGWLPEPRAEDASAIREISIADAGETRQVEADLDLILAYEEYASAREQQQRAADAEGAILEWLRTHQADRVTHADWDRDLLWSVVRSYRWDQIALALLSDEEALRWGGFADADEARAAYTDDGQLAWRDLVQVLGGQRQCYEGLRQRYSEVTGRRIRWPE